MLKILQLNCRGYYGNRHWINETLQAEDPDVVLLNHVGVIPPNRHLRYYGYTTQVTSTTEPHDGIAILVKTTLRSEFIKTWHYQHFLAIKIFTHHSQMIIATTYARPNAGIPYGDIISLFNSTHIPVYFIADLNAQHPCFNHPRANTHGSDLRQILHQKNLRFLGPDFPTCYAPNGTGRPDLALTNRRSLHLHHHMTPGRPCGSDHLPVILCVSETPISVPSPPHYNYQRADWDAFGDALSSYAPANLEGKHHTALDTEITRIHTAIQQAAEEQIPKSHHKIYRDFRPSIRTQRLTICYNARFQQHGNNPQHQRDLNILRQHILNSLSRDHEAHWQHLISHTESYRTTNPTYFWQKIKNLEGAQSDKFQYLTIDNNRLTDPQDVADAFKEHWQTIFQPHPLPAHPPSLEHIHEVEHSMSQQNTAPLPTIDTSTLRANDYMTAPFREDTVENLLKKTKRRAPGPAGITWALARHLPQNIIQSLTAIYNASLASGYFPTAFKTATTILIPKPGKNHHQPDNYRPISLLEVTGKTYERLLNSRLRLYLEDNDLLSKKQYGFRQHCSTEDALNTITTYLKLTPHLKYAIVTKDIQKAFDTVWHTGLKFKICNNFNLPPLLQRLLCNFLTQRSVRIKHKSSFSPPFTPQAGVPQGSVLSPTLFNMYVHDIPDPSHAEAMIIQYADDVTLLSRARTTDSLTNRVQIELNNINLWEQKWRMLSHPEKSNVTYLNIRSNTPRMLHLNPLEPNHPPIRRTRTTKILGVTFDERLTFNQHISNKAAIAKTSLHNLERFRGCREKTKLHLYKALVRPTITYCPLALSLAAKCHLIKLQRIQNRALRLAYNTHWTQFKRSQDLHESAKIPPLNITIHNRLLKQLEKFQLTHETIIEHINTLPPFRQAYPNKNLLLLDSHEPPAPIYT